MQKSKHYRQKNCTIEKYYVFLQQNYYSPPIERCSVQKNARIMKYVCEVCGWEYDPAAGAPEAGIPAGTPWEEVPEDFVCPLCGVGKDSFAPAE